MDIDSPFEAAPRACDRCHSLKTQCPFGNPCGRCERLGLTCTNDRPQRTRGRPPKSASRTRPSTYTYTSRQQSPEDTALLSSQSASPPTDVSPFLRGLPELSLSYEVILPLVQQFLLSTPHSGLYSIIPACTTLELSYDHPPKQTFEDVILQPEFRCTFVAIALELHGSKISGYQLDKAKIDRDSLHLATLSFMQKIPSKENYLTLANVLCLLLLSHTWCRVEIFTEAATQWCSLARFAFDHAKREYESKSLYSRELVRRIDIGLHLQEW
ncbi:hypothetical protein N7488_001371 [Penicillium malachiteum]|nr:hypothetical protein N7488_001371 [Penicillium malachiteum]